MTTIATSATRPSPSAQKSSPFSAMCVRCWRKQKSLCTFAASVMATATSLLITAASCWPSMAAESPVQSNCLTRTQAEQTWPHSHLYWHTERHCWDVTPVGQSHRLADVTPVGQSHRFAYVSAAPAPTERQATTMPVNN